MRKAYLCDSFFYNEREQKRLLLDTGNTLPILNTIRSPRVTRARSGGIKGLLRALPMVKEMGRHVKKMQCNIRLHTPNAKQQTQIIRTTGLKRNPSIRDKAGLARDH